MKKSELKTGMILEFKGTKARSLVLLNTENGDFTCNCEIEKCDFGDVPRLFNFFELEHLTEDLKDNTNHNMLNDVIKVYGKYGDLIWTRPKEPKELESNKWYKYVGGVPGAIAFKNGEGASYGIGEDGKWMVDSNNKFECSWAWGTLTKWVEATQGEVTMALTKVAIEKGFKPGDFIDNRNIGFEGNGKISYEYPQITHHWDKEYLSVNGMAIFKDGKWASIKTSISKEEAEKRLGIKIL